MKKRKSSGALQSHDPATLRPLNAPRPIRVRTGSGGRPRVLYMRGGSRRVAQIREIWQVDDEWWREPISRRYATLVLEDGLTVTLYRDLLTGKWYLQEG